MFDFMSLVYAGKEVTYQDKPYIIIQETHLKANTGDRIFLASEKGAPLPAVVVMIAPTVAELSKAQPLMI